MPIKKLKDFLDQNGVKYTIVPHTQAYTAQEIAAAAHIPGYEMAKTVIIKMLDHMVMVVLPASHKIDVEKLKVELGEANIELATEAEFQELFPDCVVGAMPPFGNLYGMDVIVAKRLAQDEQIAFNAGSHTELVQMPYKDFERLVHPTVVSMT